MQQWRVYDVTLKFRERVMAGIPRTGDTGILEGWLKGQGVEEAEDRAAIAQETAQEIADQVEEVIEKNSSMFKVYNGSLVLEARQIKALLKEMASVSGFNSDYRGLKNLLQHGLFVKPHYIPLGVEEESGALERTVHTFRGSAIKRADYVETPEVSFQVWALPTNPVVRRQRRKKEGDLLFDEMLEQLFLWGQENGLGAWRTQGEGQYDLVNFKLVE